MGLDLFSFDFTEENNEMMTDEKVSEQFSILQQIFKENYNSYIQYISDLPAKMINYLDEFEKRGWIEKRGSDAINIVDDFLLHFTVDEVIGSYKEKIQQVLVKPDVNWHNDVLPVINHASMPVRYKDNETREKIYELRSEVIKEVAIGLGLDHFLNVPEARGHKMSAFSSKWIKKNVIPIIAERVIPITDYDEMKKFINENFFFCGRRDWNYGKSAKSAIKTTPHPEFKKIFASYLEIASLCEAEDEETIELILEYCGYSAGSYSPEYENNFIFPRGWSIEKYLTTLTDEDKNLLIYDRERLKRLHGRDIMKNNIVFKNIS